MVAQAPEDLETVRSLPSLTAWRNAVLGIFALQGFVAAGWVSRVPQVRDILHASTGEMGLVLGGLAAGGIAGLLVSGSVITWLGVTRTIAVLNAAVALCVLALGVLLTVLPNVVLVILVLVVCGGSAYTSSVAGSLSGAANERALGRTLMPVFHAFFSVGTVAGAGVGALLLLLRVPIGVQFVGTGALAVAAILVLVRFLRPAEQPPEPGGEQRKPGWRERLAVWRDPRVLLLGLIVLGMAFAEGSANDWLSLAMVDGHHVPVALGAAVFGLFVVAMTVGRLVGAKLLDRYGRVPMLRACAALAVTGLLLVIAVPVVPIAIVGAVLWGLGASLGFPVGISAAADDPRTATAGVSAVATIGYCAFLVGPPVIGFLGQRFGILNALLLVALLVALAGLASPVARQRKQADPTGAEVVAPTA
jgi:predicted MFS family arabinose efflux permease